MKLTNEPGAGYRFRRWRWAMVCLVLSAAGPVYANESRAAQALLQRMTQAVRSTNYVGVCIYRFGDNLKAIRVVHQVKDGHQHERLFSLNGPVREIIHSNTGATYAQPEEHFIVENLPLLDTPLDAALPGNSTTSAGLVGLYNVYDLELLGAGRVAGREARRLNIVSRDHFRYGYRLWIDENSGLLLRSDLVDETGEPLEQIMFTAIETPDTIPDRWLKPTFAGDEVSSHREHAPPIAVTSAGSAWAIDHLPEGFRLTFQERHPAMGEREGPVEHWLYSDGLATVSVYIQQEGDHPFNGWSRMGAVSAFGRTLDDHQIVVVGEVPPATVQWIGESVRRTANEP